MRAVSAPFGPLTDAQWEHSDRTNVRAAPGRALGTHYDPRHRRAVSRRRPRRPICGRCGTRSAARRWCCAARNPTCCPAATAAEMAARGPRPRSSSSPASATRRCCCRRSDRSRRSLPAVADRQLSRAAPRSRVNAVRSDGRSRTSGVITLPSLTIAVAHASDAQPASGRPEPGQSAGNAAGQGGSVARRPRSSATPIEAARLIGDALAATNRVAMCDSRRLELAEQYWDTADRAVAAARGALRARPASAGRRRARRGEGVARPRARARDRLQATCSARKRASAHLLGGNRLLVALVHRCLQCTTRILINSYLSYSPVPPRTWHDVHRIYAFARERGLTSAPCRTTTRRRRRSALTCRRCCWRSPIRMASCPASSTR